VDISGIVKYTIFLAVKNVFFSVNLLAKLISQAMVHELIGIDNNKVDLTEFSTVPKDQQVVKSYISSIHIMIVKCTA
jgi:hypothetical protein